MSVDYETASTRHLESADWFERIYEPQEDSWLFCDALAGEFSALKKLSPSLVAEIGPGSGIVSTTLLKMFEAARSPIPACVVADINFVACEAALSTAAHNLYPLHRGSGLPASGGASDISSAAFQLRLPADISCCSSSSVGERTLAPFYDAVAGDLLLPMLPRLAGKVDILLFNPPYVPTEDEEVPTASLISGAADRVLAGSALRAPLHAHDDSDGPASCSTVSRAPATECTIAGGACTSSGCPDAAAGKSASSIIAAPPPNLLAAAWAGGDRGRRVIDRALPLLPLLLSRPRGVAYMILVEENDPTEIATLLSREHGLRCTIIARTKAKNERLCVMRIRWPPASSGVGTACARAGAAGLPTAAESAGVAHESVAGAASPAGGAGSAGTIRGPAASIEA